jgi:hypothetical protein
MIYKLLQLLRKKVSNIPNDCDCKHILYDYVLWNNSIEGNWYAINRNYYTLFFAGGDDRERVAALNGYVVAKDLTKLIQLIIELHDKER